MPIPPYYLVHKGKSALPAHVGFEKAFIKEQGCEEKKNTLVESADEANMIIEQLQTDAKMMVVPYVAIESRYYLAIAVDRKKGVTFVASIDDELSLEERVKERRLFREIVPEKRGLHQFQIRRLLSHLGIKENSGGMKRVIEGMVQAFFYFDAVRIVISPLGCTEDGNFLALNLEMEVDENALFRQPEIRQLIGETAQVKHGQEGTIGCMANGKGLCVATCDLVRVTGAFPTEALDIGDDITTEKVVTGLQSLYGKRHVEGVIVNIFAGLVDCEKIARAIGEQITKDGLVKPTVVRLEGTNATKGCELLKKLTPGLVVTTSLEEVAKGIKDADSCR